MSENECSIYIKSYQEGEFKTQGNAVYLRSKTGNKSFDINIYSNDGLKYAGYIETQQYLMHQCLKIKD